MNVVENFALNLVPKKIFERYRSFLFKRLTRYYHFLSNKFVHQYLQSVVDGTVDPKVSNVLISTQLDCTFNDPIGVPKTAVENYQTKLDEIDFAASVLKDILPLKQVVGIQPTTGPVGLGYRLEVMESTETQFELFDSVGEPKFMPELTISVTSSPVECKTRQLQASYSPEIALDMKMIHGLDVHKEMLRALSSEIAYEIVNEVIGTMVEHSTKSEACYGDDLLTQIRKEIGKTGVRTHRGAATFIVTDPIGSSVLQHLAGSSFVAKQLPTGEFIGLSNFIEVGTLDGKVTVFSTLSPSVFNKFIVGYKNSDMEIDTGMLYMPYMLALRSKTVDIENFVPTQKIATRHGFLIKEDNVISDTKNYFTTISYNPTDVV